MTDEMIAWRFGLKAEVPDLRECTNGRYGSNES